MLDGKIKAFLFDLDGTLLDTGPDLASALNQVLKQYNKPPVNYDDFRYTIYGGSLTMLKHGLGIDENHPDFEDIKQQFLQTYFENSTNKTVFFDGMQNVLNHLDSQQIQWGIVTNKPEWLTTPIIDHFNLEKRACCVIAGDTLPRRKPHPDQLLHACELIATHPSQTAYVGDTETDAIAAKAANMHSITATYGYHKKHNHPNNWDTDVTDVLIDSAIEIIECLKL